MNEFKIFIGFFRDAITVALRNRRAFLFGLLLTLSSMEYLSSLLEEGAPLGRYRDSALDYVALHPEILSVLPLTIALATFSKGGIILALTERKASIGQLMKRVASSFWKLYALEMGALFSLFLLLAVLLFPAMLTADMPGLGLNLAFLGLAIFLPISIVIAFIEIYAFFHLLLSKTTLRTAVELAYTLFISRAATSLVFGFVSILVLIAFSVILGLILGVSNALIPDSIGGIISVMLVLFLFQSFLSVIQKGAWLSFFRFIATPVEPAATETTEPSQKEENMVQKEVPGIG